MKKGDKSLKVFHEFFCNQRQSIVSLQFCAETYVTGHKQADTFIIAVI